MLASSLLIKKRDGHALADEEIQFLVSGFCTGEVADYQMSALAMAICLQGMDPREIATLTKAMLDSGDRLPRSNPDRIRVDKHSTGGLGDKVSLILAPLLASCDLDVPMISGRGLGITGGTLDKLESIPGFQTHLSTEQSEVVLRDVGAFIIGASDHIAPADRKLYALRDVTGTVESIALITASILSKKLAANLDRLVMDVKTGDGAFMKTEADALRLAKSLVSVGKQAGLPTTAILSDMNQPLGSTVGNAIEVNEAVDVLRGHDDGGGVRDLSIELAAETLLQTELVPSLEEGRRRLADIIDSGLAMERFERMVHAQGGEVSFPLPSASEHVIPAARDGFLSRYDCRAIGEVVIAMGGGRKKVGESIDHSVGIKIHPRIGDRVERGDPIFTVHCHDAQTSDYLMALTSSGGAAEISDAPVPRRPFLLHRVAEN